MYRFSKNINKNAFENSIANGNGSHFEGISDMYLDGQQYFDGLAIIKIILCLKWSTMEV